VVKSAQAELVSLCFPGAFKKTDAKTYQVHLSNFQPNQDLEVYFGNVEPSDDSNNGLMPVLNKGR
jgi:hypothetical protein